MNQQPVTDIRKLDRTSIITDGYYGASGTRFFLPADATMEITHRRRDGGEGPLRTQIIIEFDGDTVGTEDVGTRVGHSGTVDDA